MRQCSLPAPKASGKTLFCRLIRHRLDGTSCKVVYLDNPVGSFDELLGRICLQLGMPLSADMEQDMTAVLQTLLRGRQEKGKRVLLLIDEAEKMFLAALERLFRLLNELNEQYGTQAMLVGRPALNISLEQLSGYCEDVRIASSYKLEAFSPEETGAYLVYRLRAAGGGRGLKDPVFSGDAVQEIFRLGKGVPGVTDGIAEAALENAAAVGAGSVLPVHVAVPDDPDGSPVQFDDEESGGRRTGLLLLLALCLLAFFFCGRTSFFSDQEDASQEAVQESVGVVPENTEISLALPEDEDAPLPFVEEDDGADNPAEEPSLFSLPVPHPDFKKKEEEKSQSPRGKISGEEGAEVVAEAAEEKPAETRPALSPEELQQAAQATSSGEPGSETLATAKKLPVIKPTWIIELAPGMKKTRPPAPEEHAVEKPAPESGQEEKKQQQPRRNLRPWFLLLPPRVLRCQGFLSRNKLNLKLKLLLLLLCGNLRKYGCRKSLYPRLLRNLLLPGLISFLPDISEPETDGPRRSTEISLRFSCWSYPLMMLPPISKK